MRIYALVTDAYGGSGGIAVYNRDLLEAFCSHPAVEQVIAVPRVISRPMELLPQKLIYRTAAAKGPRSFLFAIIRDLKAISRSDFIYCAHLNLAPVAWALSRIFRIPVLGALYGIEAWAPRQRFLADRLGGHLDHYYSISEFTRRRFLSWSGTSEAKIAVLPNAIHPQKYGMGDRSATLAARMGLQGRTVLMTLGRVVSRERAKGFDEVIDVLPDLAQEIPNIAYMIAGDGDYRTELERKVTRLQLSDRVVFTGFVREDEKADLYRLADLYVMPSRGEGFGFVFLEAMACGVPVVASCVDGSRDAVRDGQLGRMINPDNRDDLKRAIVEALREERHVPQGLSYFYYEEFSRRTHALIDNIVQRTNGDFGIRGPAT